MPTQKKKGKKVKVIKWRDSQMHITQEPQDTRWEVAIITSVGFVIADDAEKIVLAGDLLGDDARRVIVIPKENII